MSIEVDKKQHYKTIDKTCYTANIVYLILHVFYLVLFIITKLYIMVGVTAGVVFIYCLYFLLIKKKKYYLYALICGNVFFAYIATATAMIGFNTGFHFYLIGLCVVSFFTTYFSKNKKIFNSIIWAVLSLAIYLTLYLTSSFNPPNYTIDKWLEMTLFIINAIVVFGFIATYLFVFLKYALSLEKKITNESRTDELTQIKNRYGLYDFYESLEEKKNLTLALFDIDNFKVINDKHGHVTGDYILKRVAEITSETLDDSFVCRYGGEEFIIVLENDKEVHPITRLEELRNRIKQEKFEFEGETIQITITIGVADYFDSITLEKWVELADERMYKGKETGKNKIVYK
ncbi:MAG: GGDEF domain-containing protein [Bacilli bacterium]|nr:GGDEF domain-containing protein [Bacilli bacterium]